MTIDQTVSRTLTVCACVVVGAALMGLGYVSQSLIIGGIGAAIWFGLFAYAFVLAVGQIADLQDEDDLLHCGDCGRQVYHGDLVWMDGKELCHGCTRLAMAARFQRARNDKGAA